MIGTEEGKDPEWGPARRLSGEEQAEWTLAERMAALGKLGKGKRKALSQEERWRRAQRLAAVRGRRWS